jgi:LmbE family N-acetylglucosaminyl deacetylase
VELGARSESPSVQTLTLPVSDRAPRHLLCLGAHCDDIEIGCSGAVLTLLEQDPEMSVTWVVLASNERRAAEAHASAHALLAGVAKRTILVQSFRDGFLPYHGAAVKEYIETLKADAAPDLVLTHYRHDLHQDHRLVSELTWNTFRDHLIWEYEIPKYDGDMGNPNFFVPLEPDVCQRKVRNILASFPSQTSKPWFREDLFLALMRLRGMECHAPSGYAEGFYCRKAVLGGPGGRARSSRSR